MLTMLHAERRTITLMFTDIEGSTRLWESHPQAMRRALARHDALVSEAIAQHGGRVFKTVGDAFCAAFESAAEALRAALAVQASLAHEAWPDEAPVKVRAALHTGEVEDTGRDFVGAPLNRVARLLAAGHGGQTLVSRSTFEASGGAWPEGASLRDLGVHKLKDLAHAEHVYELAHPALPGGFAPIRSLSTHPNNLPEQLTSFVGRADEARTLTELMERTRLVTVTGAGGSGKTRLALEVAAGALEQFPAGVWVSELAPVADGALVADAVATTLGVKETPGQALVATIAQRIAKTRLLLVLDNCEHVVAGSAALAAALLAQCPGLRIVATSREALGVPGEQTWRVTGLSVPVRDARPQAEVLWQSEAVQLFVDRARLVRPGFDVDGGNAAALASLCHRLDGIPLAIELAAARVRSLTVQEIDARLGQRFDLLTSRSRTVLPRHQTLRALVDWSYDLLTEAERRVLQQAAVFAGGWTLPAAEAVCAGDAADMLDLLTSLADKSLVLAEQPDGGTRYRLLETVREYARERLHDSGTMRVLRERHCAYFVAFATGAVPALAGATQAAALRHLAVEHDNLRQALDWCATAPDRDAGLRLCGALGRFWMIHGHLTEGRAWCARFLAGNGPPTRERADAINTDGTLAYAQGDYASARAQFEACLAIRRELREPRAIAAVLSNLGAVANVSGEQAQARTLYEESLALARAANDAPGVARAIANLANVVAYLGDHAAARPLYEESLAMQRAQGDHGYVSITLDNLAEVAYLQGDFARSCELYRESLSLRRELGDRSGIADSLEGLATALAPQGGGLAVARIMAAARKLREEIGSPPTPYKRETYDRRIAAARAAMRDGDAFDRAWEEGRALSLDDAIALALATER
jgi:predicted ATPase/class 3 adenylate cyclase